MRRVFGEFRMLLPWCMLWIGWSVVINYVSAGNSFEDSVLKEHNRLRRRHESPNLIVDNRLINWAKKRAKKFAASGSLQQCMPGMNTYSICTGLSFSLSGKEITDNWYKEACKKDFRFDRPAKPAAPCSTQLLWRDTKKLGIGFAYNNTVNQSCVYIVALYRPPGNIHGFYKENVHTGSFDRKLHCKNMTKLDLGASLLKEKLRGIHRKEPAISQAMLHGKDGFLLGKQKTTSRNERRTFYFKPPSTVLITGDQDEERDSIYAMRNSIGDEDQELNSRSQYYRAREPSERIRLDRLLAPSNGYLFPPQASLPVDSREYVTYPQDTSPYVDSAPNFMSDIATDETITTPPSKELEAFRRETLETHNTFRHLHGSPPMLLDDSMCEKAEAWAAKLAKMGTLELGTDTDDGENSFLACDKRGHHVPARRAVAEWYKEVCDKSFAFGKEMGHQGAGHFTQVVWLTSNKLGVGVAERKSPDGRMCTYIVARYEEPGNILGSFRDNVPQGEFNLTDCKKIYDIANAVMKQGKAAAKEQKQTQATSRSDDQHSDGDVDIDLFERQILAAHNAFRNIHGSDPLQLDSDLSDQAEAWARQISKEGRLRHDNMTSNEGENLFLSCNPRNMVVPADRAVSAWYKEMCQKNYKFDGEDGDQGMPRFTQLVWKNTSNLGVGIATKKSHDGLLCTYVVGRYTIPGNKKGLYKDNVQLGHFNQSICDTYHSVASRATIEAAEEYNTVLKDSLTDAATLDALRLHNDFRKLHRSPPLRLDANATKEARKRANRIARRKIIDQEVKPSDGESIYTECSQNRSRDSVVRDAVMNWYNEACDKNYDFDAEIGTQSSGHFTQLVWKGSDRLGLATSRSQIENMTCTFVVVKYKSPGNLIGQFRENIPRGQFSGATCSKVQAVARTMSASDDKDAMKAMTIIEADQEDSTESDSVNTAIVTNGNTTSNYTKSNSTAEVKAVVPNGSNSTDEFAQLGLTAHNTLRKIHKSPPLKLDNQLTADAMEHAKKMAVEHQILRTSMEERKGAGESVAKGCRSSGKMTASEVTAIWYNTACSSDGYDFDASQISEQTGDFSQIIWKSTTLLGMGYATTKEKDEECTYVVGRYKLPGNMMGEFKENVDKGSFSSDTCKTLDDILQDSGGRSNLTNTQTGRWNESDSESSKEGEGDVCGNGTDSSVENRGSDDFAEEMLKMHNKARKIHSVKDLKLDSDLSSAAKKYAAKIAKSKTLEHASSEERNKLGENLGKLCLSNGRTETAASFMKIWYKEACGYDFDSSEFSPKAGEFTQVIWKGSTLLGVGFATSKEKGQTCTYTVCRYKEEGNTLGDFKGNIAKGSFKNSSCENLDEIFGDSAAKLGAIPSQASNASAANYAEGFGAPCRNVNNPPAKLVIDKRTSEAFVTEGLNAHNRLRAMHNSPLMKVNAKLTKEAEEHAQMLARRGIASGSSDASRERQGESVASSCGMEDKEMSATDAVKSWYSEVCKSRNFDFTNPIVTNDVKRFGQLVWKNNTEMGMGRSTSIKDGVRCTIIVAKYGNGADVRAEPKSNIEKGKFNREKICQQNPIDEVFAEKRSDALIPNNTTEKNATQSNSTEKSFNVKNDSISQEPLEKATSPSAIQNNENESVAKRDNHPDEFCEEGLKWHNVYRVTHGAPALTTNQNLCKEAQELALKAAKDDMLDHSENENGENLALKRSAKGHQLSAAEATLNWYIEVCSPGYGFTAKREEINHIGHFSQVIWHSTTSLGMGRATIQRNNETYNYVVALYRPAGNFIDEFNGEVKKGSFKRSMCPLLKRDLESMEESPTDRIVKTKATNRHNVKETDDENVVVDEPLEIKLNSLKNSTRKRDTDESSSVSSKEGEKELSLSPDDQALVREILTTHNRLRRIHSSPPLKIDASLYRLAKERIEKIEKEGGMQLGSEGNRLKDIGENLFIECDDQQNKTIDPKEVTMNWYKESCRSNILPGSTTDYADARHFAQVVWKNSKSLGAARGNFKSNNMSCRVLSALYKPMGNFLGQYDDNVRRGTFKRQYCQGTPVPTGSDDMDSLVDPALDAQPWVNAGSYVVPMNCGSSCQPPNNAGSNHAGAQPAGSCGSSCQTPSNSGSQPGGSENAANSPTDGGENTENLSPADKVAKEKAAADFIRRALIAHNTLRAIHEAPAMEIDDSISREAQAYAVKLSKRGTLDASTDNNDGENLAFDCNTNGEEMSPEDATKAW